MYAAGWFLIRAEDESETPAERVFSGASSTPAWIGIGLVLLAILILIDNFTFVSGGVIWAVGLLVIGVLLYTGDIPGLAKKDDNQEGEQEVTTTETTTTTESQALVAETDTPASDGPTGGGTPPTPTPTPPILPPAAKAPKETSFLGRLTIGFMLIGVGVLALLDAIPAVEIFPEPRHYLALAVTILGFGLLVGTIWGRARWLIIVAVVLIPTLFFSPVFEWDLTTESFDQTVVVTEFEAIEDLYSNDIGSLVIDLRELPWDNENIELVAQVDVGDLQVLIPSDVGVTGTASADIGRVGGPGQESAGIGDPTITFDLSGPNGSVDLDLHVDVGNIDVRVRG